MHFIKELSISDTDQIMKLNSIIGKCISSEFYDEDTDYKVYGIFVMGKLIGFCSIENADVISSDPLWTDDSKMISEFIIIDEYRNKGYGSELLQFILHEIPESVTIFINIPIEFPKEYQSWISKFGFKFYPSGVIRRSIDTKESDINE